MRLGHGIVIMPPAYNNPARVAERIAALDLVSHGRVEFGTGESSSWNELDAYHVPWDEKKAQWEEATAVALRMMTDTPFPGHEGFAVNYPERNIVPKPYQKPHPPVWVAGGRRETILTAARLGIGSLGFSFETPEESQERVLTYYRLLGEECRPIGAAVNPALAVLSQFACAETDEKATQRAGDGGQFFSFALNHYYNPATGPYHNHGGTNIYREFVDTPEEERLARIQSRQNDQLASLARAELNLEQLRREEPTNENQRALWRSAVAGTGAGMGAAIGSPDSLRKFIKGYEDAHLDVMLFIAQAGSRKHEDIMASIDLFGRTVLPDLKERHETVHRRWRNERLESIDYPISSSV